VATGGAEGNCLKLIEGDVDSAAEEVEEGDAVIALDPDTDTPSAEERDSDLPCVPRLCMETEFER
jgi:hypothetical protein